MGEEGEEGKGEGEREGEKVAVTTVCLSWTKCRSLSSKHPPPARHLSTDLRHKDMQITGDGRCPAAEKEPCVSTACTSPAPASLHAASQEACELRCPMPSKGWLYAEWCILGEVGPSGGPEVTALLPPMAEPSGALRSLLCCLLWLGHVLLS